MCYCYACKGIFHVDQTSLSVTDVLFSCCRWQIPLHTVHSCYAGEKGVFLPFSSFPFYGRTVFFTSISLHRSTHLKCFWTKPAQNNLSYCGWIELPGVKGLIVVALIAFQEQQFDILLTSHLTKVKCCVVSDTMYSCTVRPALSRSHHALTNNW